MSIAEDYRTLGLIPGARPELVTRAYRRLVRRYHPDVTGSEGQMLQRVIAAYRSLREAGVAGPSMREPAELGREIRESHDLSLRLAAIDEIAAIGRRSAYPFLRPALFDPDPQIVLAAVQAVGALSIRSAVADLGIVFAQGDATRQLAVLDVADALGLSGGWRSILELALRADDRRVSVRAKELIRRTRRRGAASDAASPKVGPRAAS